MAGHVEIPSGRPREIRPFTGVRGSRCTRRARAAPGGAKNRSPAGRLTVTPKIPPRCRRSHETSSRRDVSMAGLHGWRILVPGTRVDGSVPARLLRKPLSPCRSGRTWGRVLRTISGSVSERRVAVPWKKESPCESSRGSSLSSVQRLCLRSRHLRAPAKPRSGCATRRSHRTARSSCSSTAATSGRSRRLAASRRPSPSTRHTTSCRYGPPTAAISPSLRTAQATSISTSCPQRAALRPVSPFTLPLIIRPALHPTVRLCCSARDGSTR